MNEMKTWNSEYELRAAIDMAIRWKIEGVYNNRTKDNPFSVFNYFIMNSRNNFDLFCNQLKIELTKNENWKAIEIDLNDRFIQMLNRYIEWYKVNEQETSKFEPYNPYALMLSVIESTKREILKYFPKIEQSNEDKKDVRYRFYPHLEELHANEYDVMKHHFDEHGCFEINEAKLYNIELAILFQTEEAKLFNLDTKQSETINGKEYLWTFLEGYKEGEQKMQIIEKGIHSENAQAYILDLHNNYYHNKVNGNFEGWNYVKKINIFSFTYKEIKYYGMYSAMVSKTDELAKDYKNLFLKFEVCEHDKKTNGKQKTRKEIEVGTSQPSLKQLALYHVYLGTKITIDNCNEYLKGTEHKSGKKLKQEFDKYTKTSNRIYGGTERENSAKLKLFKEVIIMLENSKNLNALLKAKNELIQFEKSIE